VDEDTATAPPDGPSVTPPPRTPRPAAAAGRLGYYSYRLSKLVVRDYDDFYTLIAAAMRLADTENSALLRAAWPDVWDELRTRYNAPGGLLPDESTSDSAS
jgi:hypothetical protein